MLARECTVGPFVHVISHPGACSCIGQVKGLIVIRQPRIVEFLPIGYLAKLLVEAELDPRLTAGW